MIKLENIAEAFPRIKENIEKLGVITKNLPYDEEAYLDLYRSGKAEKIKKISEDYVITLADLFKKLSLEVSHEHIDYNIGVDGSDGPKFEIELKYNNDKIVIHFYYWKEKGSWRNNKVFIRKEGKSMEREILDCRDFEKIIEWVINKSYKE